MKEKEKYLELIQKIKKLAETSKTGKESENAYRVLERLMKKYDISFDEIEEEVVKSYFMTFDKQIYGSELILRQVVYSTIQDYYSNEDKGLWGSNKSKSKSRWGEYLVKCTTAEFIEIEAKYNFYLAKYKEDIEAFSKAFIVKNKIYRKYDMENRDKIEYLDEQENYRNITSIANALEKHEFHKQIECDRNM